MQERRKLLVLGCGFAGFSLLYNLRTDRWDATLLSPRNYFLFTPLLPSATSGSVEFRSILEPARRRLREVRLIEGSAESIDFQAKRVSCTAAVSGEPFQLEYDDLIIAVGSAVGDYGIPGVQEHALKLASVEDARAVRRGILEQFAKAEIPGLPPEELQKRLTFVVCGGGPTGVEVAAEIDDLLDEELKRTYPELAPYVRIILVEATERILTTFDEALGLYAQQHFLREGIQVRLSSPVEAIGPDEVRLKNGERIPYGLVLWAGGNAPVPFLRSLGLPLTRRGRLPVDNFLRVPGVDDVYAIGDCAAAGEPELPATAQVAQQQGTYLAKALNRRTAGKTVEPFQFKASGMLAYIGGRQALADLPGVKWSGRAAWFFWRSVYLTKLVSPANKVKVLFDWIKARLFGRDLSRF
ncbi:MAG TPA: FAD-dependent oxidoreductase [Thermoanaerobaculia bacterium]|nr:FAD-dependent oxidoreductase [Thermoanaerobaculia bacterium]